MEISTTPTLNETQPDAARPAGFWIRGAARVLDWVVMALVGIFAGLVVALVAGLMSGFTGRDPGPFLEGLQRTTWIGWIGSTVAALAYHICFEGIAGSTAGKRVLGLQVLTEALGPITFMQGLRRSIAFLLDALFFGAVAAMNMSESPTKQRVGDLWSKTRVVRRSSVPATLHTPTLRMLAGFGVASVVSGALTAITQVLEALMFVRG